jgi:Fe-S-cluster containining protein
MTLEISHPCGGECCKRFTFGTKATRFSEYLEKILPERIADGTATIYDRDALWWLPHVHLNEPLASDGIERFHCDLLDEATGRCTIYATRPQTCREYPGKEMNGKCGACGFESPEVVAELAQLTKAPDAT